jgi:hypothetical protein
MGFGVATEGCFTEHVSIAMGIRVARVMAADQGEETWTWDWPIETGIPKDL